MAAGRAVLYCTVNGVCNNTNGLGRQTKTLLSALQRHGEDLTGVAGSFDVHLACPQPGPDTWQYDPGDLAYSRQVVNSWGGDVHGLAYDVGAEFWSEPTWRTLSREAARLASKLADHYVDVLVIAVDTPFAGVGNAVVADRPAEARGRVRVLMTFYSTALIVERPTPNPDRVEWERAGIAGANQHGGVWVADVGRFISCHLVSEYGLDAARFAPYTLSVDLSGPDLEPVPVDAARQVAARWGVPLDRPMVMIIGRTDPTKGIDLLIHALGPLRDQVHAVIIAVPFDGHDPLIDDYARRIRTERLRATFITRYTRELPRALCGLPDTRAVVCPSRGETLANVPFEVALWAQDTGPIVVAPRRDGFVEQLDDGITGVLYDPDAPGGLTAAIQRSLNLPDTQRATMRAAAARRVRAERDVARNLADTLRFFWCS